MTILIAGPYKRPAFRVGDQADDDRRGLVTVTAAWECPAGPWPAGRAEGQHTSTVGPVLCGDLIRAVRAESVAAVAHHWRVSRWTVMRWRRHLGVGRVNRGTLALLRATVDQHLDADDRRRGAAKSNARQAEARRRKRK